MAATCVQLDTVPDLLPHCRDLILDVSSVMSEDLRFQANAEIALGREVNFARKVGYYPAAGTLRSVSLEDLDTVRAEAIRRLRRFLGPLVVQFPARHG